MLWNGRKDLVDTRSDLQHRAHALVDCLWPGLTARDTKAGVRPLFCRLFEIKAARVVVNLLAEGWTPGRFAASGVDSLRMEFAARGAVWSARPRPASSPVPATP